MEFGDLTYQEIRKRAEQGWLAVVPTGCTEQQGPHLPVDFDTWFVETVCSAAADFAAKAYNIHALVLPALPFGPTPEHRNYGSGYIDIPQSLHDALILAILQSLAQQGFRRMIVWRGCGGHQLAGPVEQFNLEQAGQAQAYLPELPYHSVWCRVGDPAVAGGHADSFATALALHLRPTAVRQEAIKNPHNQEVDWADPHLDFARYSATGVIGDPTHANAELGAKLWPEVVATVATMFRDIAER